ncbi:MAG: hypothetical protein HOQ05_04390 [Corynebacteriales bacterium]|nr:hypothetical protein [Mycobacteriales bacterium]
MAVVGASPTHPEPRLLWKRQRDTLKPTGLLETSTIMLRKSSQLGLIATLALSLALAGCGDDKEAKKPRAKVSASPSSTLSAVDQQVCADLTQVGTEHYTKIMITVQQLTQASFTGDQAAFDTGVVQLKTDMSKMSTDLKEAGEPAQNPALVQAVGEVTTQMDEFAKPETNISEFDENTLGGMENSIKKICG